MPRSAYAIQRFIPGYAQWECCVKNCRVRTDQRHHVDYSFDEEWGHRSFPMCAQHHTQLHALHDGMSPRVHLLLFSCNFIADPDATALRALRLTPSPAEATLDFGQQFGLQGEYWRALEVEWGLLRRGETEAEDMDDAA